MTDQLSGDRVLLVTNVKHNGDEFYACGVSMTAEQYERVKAARAQGVRLNTHAEIAAFLGMKPTPGVTLRMSPTPAPTRVLSHEERSTLTPLMTPPDVQDSRRMARGAAVATPGTMRCFNCDTPIPPQGVRCAQCGALVAD